MSQRRVRLHDSNKYQQFLRNLHEVVVWISEKMKTAMDESYRDPTNLEGKKQKHHAFNAENSSNKRRLAAVLHEGQNLVNADHYASDDIIACIDKVRLAWMSLEETSGEKSKRLEQAYQALQFNRQVCQQHSFLFISNSFIINST